MRLITEINVAIDQAVHLKHVTYVVNMAASHLDEPERDAMQVMLDDVGRQLLTLKTQLYHVREAALSNNAGGVQ